MKNRIYSLVIFQFILPTTLYSQEKNIVDDSLKQKLSAIAVQELTSSGIPSIQLSVGMKGKLIVEGAFGQADVENNVPATVDTKYRTASVNKWMTATLAMILVNEKKLLPDAPIQQYCPSFPSKKWTITTAQLLSHTSGIRSYIELEKELPKATSREDSASIKQRYDLEQLGKVSRYTDMIEPLGNFKNDTLLFKPGTDWEYTSQGYRVLGCVIEGASKQSYRAQMKDIIFTTAGMTNTVEDDSWAIIHNRASCYTLARDKKLLRAAFRDVSENLPAGGYLTTASDLVRFMNAFEAGKLVSRDVIIKMINPFGSNTHVSNQEPSWRDAIPAKNNYGYGMMIFSGKGELKYGHTGRQPGTSAIIMSIPRKQFTIAVLTNADGWNGYIDFVTKIEKVVLEFLSRKIER